MMTRPRYYPRLPWWRRACLYLDANPVEIVLLLVAVSYVGTLALMCIRHMATGLW